MDKLTMAHEYALKMLENLNPMQMEKPTRDGIAYECFELAEAMQAEADKRNNKEACGKNIGLDSSVLKEWQPDWSQAPEIADAWRMYGDNRCAWLIFIGGDFKWLESAPSFDYKGNYRDSLRNRPEGK